MSRPENSSFVRLGYPTWMLVLIGLAISFVAVFAIEPGANDGLADQVAVIWVPALVIASLGLVLQYHSSKNSATRYSKGWILPLAVVFPIASLLIFVGAIQRDPEYYAPERDGGFWGAIGVWFLFFFIAVLLGPLIWGFLLMPLSLIVNNIVKSVRGEKVRPHMYLLPGIMLIFSAFVLISSGAVDPDNIGKGAGITIFLAVLGIPGPYEIESEPLLWVARGVLALITLALITNSLYKRRAESVKSRKN